MQNIEELYLLLGNFCNTTCRHCLQTKVKDFYVTNRDFSSDVFSFIKKWSNYQPYGKIYFWGGEPLIYWNTIVNTTKQILEINPKFSLILWTNGLLLTQDIVDFLNQHNFKVILSYDMPNPSAVRNDVPSEDKIQLFMKCNNRGVNSVICGLNYDIGLMYDMLYAKFPNSDIYTHFLNDTFGSMPEDIKLKKNMIRKAIFKLADEIKKGYDTINHDKLKFIGNKIIVSAYNKNSVVMSNCGSGITKFSVDYDGNIFACHSSHWKIANINEPVNIIRSKFKKAFLRKLSDKCLSCPVVSLCHGGCPIAPRNSDGTILMCDVYKEYYSSCLDVFEQGVLPLNLLKQLSERKL